MNRLQNEQRITLALRDLGDIEIEILNEIVSRLSMGQRQYGVFKDEDPRDWRKETLAEVLDAMVYSARVLVK